MKAASILTLVILSLQQSLMTAQQTPKPLIRFSNPPALSQPTRYSHVAEVLGGRLVFISGQISEDAKGNVIGKGDIKAQTRQVLMNLKAALEAVGGNWSNVVKMNTYLTDSSYIEGFREVREEVLADVKPRPASTAIVMTKLFGKDWLVEIDAVAVVPEKPLPALHSAKSRGKK